VTWGAQRGYLTAGHVGQKVGAKADDGSGHNIGTVVFVQTGSTGAQSQACTGSSVDVAVIELNPGVQHGNSLGIVATAVPQPRSAVAVHTRLGVQKVLIYGATK
jgi:hypothetical protein